jgi:Lipid A 3-O-deacylase (PagL)
MPLRKTDAGTARCERYPCEACMKSWAAVLMIVPLVLSGHARPGEAFDAGRVFTKGGYVLSLEGGYGEQFDAWNTTITGLDSFNAGVRFGLLPWGATGSGSLKGALEIGVEPFYQRFIDPVDAFFAGLGVVARYHILPFGRFVPYIELSAAPGATDLRVREQDTDFVFLLFGGIGASYFITDRTAFYAGYRLQHISNAYTDSPNRGIYSHTGGVGLSILFP